MKENDSESDNEKMFQIIQMKEKLQKMNMMKKNQMKKIMKKIIKKELKI